MTGTNDKVDTPRTDAKVREIAAASREGLTGLLDMTAHAQQLERELAEAKEREGRAWKQGERERLNAEALKISSAQAALSAERDIDRLVDRFLSWKLPEDFHPDAGISFSPYFNVEYNAKHGKPPQRHEPIGTNLLTATQAKAMLEHVLGEHVSAIQESAYERARRTRTTEDPCKCGQHKVPVGIDGINWYWQRHSREACTLELPNERCWCGLLRSEHLTGHDKSAHQPGARADSTGQKHG